MYLPPAVQNFQTGLVLFLVIVVGALPLRLRIACAYHVIRQTLLRESGDRILHHFPNPEKDRERFNKWLYAIGGDILKFENEHIYKNRHVCRAHFEQKHLCWNKGLTKVAVPTLNMPDILSTSKFVLCEAQRTSQSHTQKKLQPLTTSDCANKQLASTSSMNVTFTKDATLEKENIDPVVEGGTNIVLHQQGNVANISTPITKQDSQENLENPLKMIYTVRNETAEPATKLKSI